MDDATYLDALLTLPTIANAQVSRDGRWIAWTWFNAGPTADVYVAATDGSGAPTRLSDSSEHTLLVSWAPDSQSLIVKQDCDGDEHVQLFQISLAAPLQMRALTEPRPTYFVQGGQLHPSGRWLLYSANYDLTCDQTIEATWIYRHDIATGDRQVLARPARGGPVVPELSPDGAYVLYPRRDLHPGGQQIWLVDSAGHHDREILNLGPAVKLIATWLPDSQRVLVRAEGGTHVRIGLWEMASGTHRWLIDDPARNIESAAVARGGEQIIIIEWQQARVRSSLLDLATGVELPLPELPGNLIPLAAAADGTWIGQFFSSIQPTDLVRFQVPEVDPASFVSLAQVWARTALTADDLIAAENVHWQSVDGLPIQGWLYRPRQPSRGTVVYVHGGPTAHIKDQVYHELQFLAQRGFTVFVPNYRGSTGFSLAFREAIKADGWGGREQEDIRSGIRALLDQGIAEPGRIGITGTSYGGYSAWHAIVHFPLELVAAAVPICGMTDLVVDYDTTRPDLRPYSEEMMGGSPAEIPERYYQRSPIHFVDAIRARLLIVQGLQDPNVTPENVYAVTAALDQAGVPYELLTFDDEGHGIAKPKNVRTLYLRLDAFFEAAFTPARR